MGEDEDSEAEAHDLGGGAEADSGGAAGTVGEGEDSGVKELTMRRLGEAAQVRNITHYPFSAAANIF